MEKRILNNKKSTRIRTQAEYGLFSCKRSQIGATITWMVAVIVILFIMIIYVLVTMGIAAVKGASEDAVQKSASEKIIATEELISVVNSPIGNNGILIDEIKSSLDVYLSNSKLMELLGGDINKLAIKRESISSEIFLGYDYDDERISADIEKILDSFCEDYIFQTPNIKIDKSKTNSEEVFMAEFTEEITLDAPYKGQIIKIKYRKSKNC